MDQKNHSRRNILKFLGASAALPLIPLSSCTSTQKKDSIFPTRKDDVVLADGLQYEVLISWGDQINSKEVFGFNNDYINYISLAKDELLLWVNHEYFHPLFVSSSERTKKNVDIERSLVGGSIINVKKVNGKWKFNKDSKYNKGVRGDTPIPFHNNIKIEGTNTAIGTLANCAGGKTPWGTILTCEENYHMFYGDRKRRDKKFKPSAVAWENFYPHPTEHYGWVVEIDLKTAKAKKLTTIGRFAHESATCIRTKNGNVAVYSGDDKNNEFIYKFISNSKDNLDTGILYVADTVNGKWIPLDLELSPKLKKKFSSQLEVLTYVRQAAKYLGATPQNRPEDVEVHPETGDVYITLTNNKKKDDFFGSILKISEDKSDHGSTSFKSETFLLGGPENNFACPDNLAFDQNSNLWFVTDMSGKAIGKAPYKNYGNNGLFVVPTKGKNAGEVIQLGSAPVDAEFTGLCFSPDQKELFLSVQHPGELTKDLKNPTSTWPSGKMPKPSVIVITGKTLENFTQLS